MPAVLRLVVLFIVATVGFDDSPVPVLLTRVAIHGLANAVAYTVRL